MPGYELVLFKNIHDPRAREIDRYVELGGYEASRKVLTGMTPSEVIDMTKASGLRGRGGAGFPTGMKWSFVPKNTGKPTYLCCNADESEPGTCKDRVIIERDPHQLIEGIIIASFAVECHLAFIYIRGEFVHGYRVLERALAEARAKGFLGRNIFGTTYDLEIVLHSGAGAYICGEETGLLESLEGKRGHPRQKPPFPAVQGLYACPTVVNNVETLANLPHLFNRGVDWYKSLGSNEKNTGPKLYCVSGHVNKPAVVERELGIPLPELINDICGGVRDGHQLKGVIPGGSSVPILTPGEIDVRMDFDSLAAKGTLLGSAGCMVLDDSVCMVRLAYRTARFYAEETCGQCTQCREGTWWMEHVLHRIEHGQGRMQDLDMILDMCSNMKGVTICVLSDACAMPVEAMIRKYREEFAYHITEKRCMAGVGAHA
ncbi:MAG TPA: NADH-quinone oxidoreductase subunit NuoF [Terriglobia bacterium]|nr:NADH-quinone oxidoreductase subunit NuoF [Terriglobia bacterium]